jgi:hypothetical protein
MSIRPPGNLESGPNAVTTNARGGVSVPIRGRGPGAYILVVSTSPNGPGVRVQQGEIGAVNGGRITGKLTFGSSGSSGRYVPIPDSPSSTILGFIWPKLSDLMASIDNAWSC